jgi:hypothetical protein
LDKFNYTCVGIRNCIHLLAAGSAGVVEEQQYWQVLQLSTFTRLFQVSFPRD